MLRCAWSFAAVDDRDETHKKFTLTGAMPRNYVRRWPIFQDRQATWYNHQR